MDRAADMWRIFKNAYRNVSEVVDHARRQNLVLEQILPVMVWRHKGDFVVNVIFICLYLRRSFTLRSLYYFVGVSWNRLRRRFRSR